MNTITSILCASVLACQFAPVPDREKEQRLVEALERALREGVTTYSLGPTNGLVSVTTNRCDWIITCGPYVVTNQSVTITPQEHIDAMHADGTLTNVVRQLLADGTVCAVRGHAWGGGRPGELDSNLVYADLHPGVFFRTCRLCGLVQSQKLTDWR